MLVNTSDDAVVSPFIKDFDDWYCKSEISVDCRSRFDRVHLDIIVILSLIQRVRSFSLKDVPNYLINNNLWLIVWTRSSLSPLLCSHLRSPWADKRKERENTPIVYSVNVQLTDSHERKNQRRKGKRTWGMSSISMSRDGGHNMFFDRSQFSLPRRSSLLIFGGSLLANRTSQWMISVENKRNQSFCSS